MGNEEERNAPPQLYVLSTKLQGERKRNSTPLSHEQFWKLHDEGHHHTVDGGLPSEHDWLAEQTEPTLTTTKNANNHNVATIPRIIHKVYLQNSGGFQNQTEMIQSQKEALQSWIDKNPTYRMQFFDLERCRAYLTEYFHPIFLRAFDCLEAFAAKADFFRQAVIYREGGWYSDWKQVCLKEFALEDITVTNVTLALYWDHNIEKHIRLGCIQTALFGAIPRHALMAEILKRMLRNIQAKHYGETPLHNTGPGTFGEAYINLVKRMNLTNNVLHGLVQRKLFRNGKEKEPIVQHKCNGCGRKQDWDNGNNYNVLHRNQQFYCQDAQALFLPSEDDFLG